MDAAGRLRHKVAFRDDGLGLVLSAEKKRLLDGGGLETPESMHGGDLAAEDESLVIDLHDGITRPLFHLFGDGAVAVFGDAQNLLGESEALASGNPIVVSNRGGADEVEVLPQDDRIGEFLINLCLPKRGAVAVDGAMMSSEATSWTSVICWLTTSHPPRINITAAAVTESTSAPRSAAVRTKMRRWMMSEM